MYIAPPEKPGFLSFPYLLHVFSLAFIYWLAAHGNNLFASADVLTNSSNWATFFNPATGIALAALLVFGFRIWPGVLIGAWAVQAGTLPFAESAQSQGIGLALLSTTGMALAQGLQTLFAYYLLQRFARFDQAFSRVRDLALLVTATVFIVSPLHAAVSALLLSQSGVKDSFELYTQFSCVWMTDALSYLLFTPAVLAVYRFEPIRWNVSKVIEAIILASLLALGCIWVMMGAIQMPEWLMLQPKVFLLFPLMVWAALSFNQRGVALVSVLVILSGLWGVAHHSGFFANDYAETRMVGFWVFTLVFSSLGYVLSGINAARVRADETLKEQRDIYDALMQAQADVNEGLMIVQDAKIVYINDALWRIGGFEPGDIPIGSSCFIVIHPSERNKLMDIHQKRLRGEDVPERYESIGLAKNGDSIPIEIAAASLRDGSNRIVVLVIDISERKKAMAALMQSQQDYRELIESVSAIVWRAKPGGAFTFVSQEAETILGYPIDEWTTNPNFWVQKIHPDDQDWVVDYCISESSLLNAHSFDYRMVAADGRVVWIHDMVKVIPDKHGIRPVELVGVMMDITSRKQAEAALRLSHQVFEHTAEGIVITDADFNVLEVNQAYENITGFSSEEMAGKKPIQLSSDLHEPHFYESIWKTIENTGQWVGEIWNRRKSGESYPEWLSVSKIVDAQGVIQNYVAVFTDITQRKLSEERLQFLANHDALTHLPNRALLQQRLEQALLRAQRNQSKIAVLFIDLDRFKVINDTLGHHAGDLLLQEAARRLQGCLRESDTVARQGGDEFVILLEDFADTQYLTSIARKIMSVLGQPFILLNQELHISASIGITVYPEDGTDMYSLLKNADVAMYRAKENGKNTFHFYAAENNSHSVELLALENSLRRALERNEFVVHYQAKVDLQTQQIIGAEALLRWQHPELGLLSPIHFISLAEETGLIIDIGAWVMQESCKQACRWQTVSADIIRVAVNLSARQFREDGLKDVIAAALEDSGLSAECLELEITESMIMQNAERASAVLQYFRDLGAHVLIDDFGTGYSSLSYLKQFPIDALKIDRSFVRDIPHDTDDMAITSAVIAMAKSLNMRVVAEGVETASQLKFLASKGCDQMQGFIFSEPISSDDFYDLLKSVNVARRLNSKIIQDAQ
jgi:diguanylate cyclase (GGDEF)-like protein/PAS domain S-box-containing protein